MSSSTPFAVLPDVVPILAETIRDRIYRQLRTLIMQGRFKPGQQLKIQELSDLFGTSSQPVREAIRQLVVDGALEALPNRSARVPALSLDAIEDLRRTRQAIESLAVELAAARVRPADIEGLARILATAADADERDDKDASLALNQEFHFTLYALSGSALLPPIIERLWMQIGPYLRRSADGFDGRGGRGTRFHDDVLKALRTGDTKAARRAIDADIDRSCNLLHQYLKAKSP